MKRTDIGPQFAAYLVVGGLAFLTEIATFIALLWGGLTPIPASVLSFLVATVVNFALSRLIAFERQAIPLATEILRFAAVAGVGLALNTAVVWLLLTFGLPPTVAKVVAVAPVLAWNFLGRRLLVFSRALPAGTWRVARRLSDRPGETSGGAAKAHAD